MTTTRHTSRIRPRGASICLTSSDTWVGAVIAAQLARMNTDSSPSTTTSTITRNFITAPPCTSQRACTSLTMYPHWRAGTRTSRMQVYWRAGGAAGSWLQTLPPRALPGWRGDGTIYSTDISMRHLFQRAGRAALVTTLAGRPLLAFDFDGTIAPMNARPEESRVADAVADLLARLASQRPVAVITGRSVDDVRPRLGFTPQYIVGNHG